MPPPEPEQPPGQDELERRLPGYRRIVIPRELTLIELLVSLQRFYSYFLVCCCIFFLT